MPILTTPQPVDDLEQLAARLAAAEALQDRLAKKIRKLRADLSALTAA